MALTVHFVEKGIKIRDSTSVYMFRTNYVYKWSLLLLTLRYLWRPLNCRHSLSLTVLEVSIQCSSLLSVHTGPGAHTASCLMGAGAIPAGVKRLGREVDQLPLSNAEFKNMWSHTATHPHAFRKRTRQQSNSVMLKIILKAVLKWSFQRFLGRPQFPLPLDLHILDLRKMCLYNIPVAL